MSWLHSQQSNFVFTVPILMEGNVDNKKSCWEEINFIYIAWRKIISFLYSYEFATNLPKHKSYELPRDCVGTGQGNIP